jgi:glutamate-1-semialdehyde 2,1-aminomutase
MQSGKVFPQIEKVGGIIMSGIDEILNRYSIPHIMSGVPSMFGIIFADRKPTDWRELYEADWDLYEEITERMINVHGVMPDNDGFEPYFLCADHTEEDAAKTLEAFEDSLKHVLGK